MADLIQKTHGKIHGEKAFGLCGLSSRGRTLSDCVELSQVIPIVLVSVTCWSLEVCHWWNFHMQMCHVQTRFILG